MEGVFGDGGASTLCRPSSRRRRHERGVPRFRHFPQDRLQDLQPVQGSGARCAHRSLAPAGALCQPAAGPGGAADRRFQARQAALGRARCRTDTAAVDRRAAPGSPPGAVGPTAVSITVEQSQLLKLGLQVVTRSEFLGGPERRQFLTLLPQVTGQGAVHCGELRQAAQPAAPKDPTVRRAPRAASGVAVDALLLARERKLTCQFSPDY